MRKGIIALSVVVASIALSGCTTGDTGSGDEVVATVKSAEAHESSDGSTYSKSDIYCIGDVACTTGKPENYDPDYNPDKYSVYPAGFNAFGNYTVTENTLTTLRLKEDNNIYAVKLVFSSKSGKDIIKYGSLRAKSGYSVDFGLTSDELKSIKSSRLIMSLSLESDGKDYKEVLVKSTLSNAEPGFYIAKYPVVAKNGNETKSMYLKAWAKVGSKGMTNVWHVQVPIGVSVDANAYGTAEQVAFAGDVNPLDLKSGK